MAAGNPTNFDFGSYDTTDWALTAFTAGGYPLFKGLLRPGKGGGGFLGLGGGGGKDNGAKGLEKRLAELAKQQQKAEKEANRANLARYAELQNIARNETAKIEQGMQNAGAQTRRDIKDQGRALRAGAYGSSVSRGLGGTTAANAGVARANQSESDALTRLSDTMSARRQAASGQIADMNMGFRERRVDQAPDPLQLAAMAEQARYNQAMLNSQPGMWEKLLLALGPAALTAGGAVLGGPMGAMIGGGIGAAGSGAMASQRTAPPPTQAYSPGAKKYDQYLIQ